MKIIETNMGNQMVRLLAKASLNYFKADEDGKRFTLEQIRDMDLATFERVLVGEAREKGGQASILFQYSPSTLPTLARLIYPALGFPTEVIEELFGNLGDGPPDLQKLEQRINEVIKQTPAIAERMKLMDGLFNPGTTLDSPGVTDTLASMSNDARDFFEPFIDKKRGCQRRFVFKAMKKLAAEEISTKNR